MVGGAFVDVMTGNVDATPLGIQPIYATLSEGEAFGWEFFAVFVVVLVYFRHVNWHAEPAGQFASESGALLYGASITAVTLMAVRGGENTAMPASLSPARVPWQHSASGAALNPARVFGAAVSADEWTHHWVSVGCHASFPRND